MPLSANMIGVTLMGTSEGAMTVSRFDDTRYGKLITARVINAFACEFCYFTPTRASADLGGQRDVPTLNLIGTHDQFFGPAPGGDIDSAMMYRHCGTRTHIPCGYGCHALSITGL